jgi:hypothetical protein
MRNSGTCKVSRARLLPRAVRDNALDSERPARAVYGVDREVARGESLPLSKFKIVNA